MVEQRRPIWRGSKSEQVWVSSFERFVFPVFGNRPVSDVEPRDVLTVLEPVWIKNSDTAHKVRHRISLVMKWAMAAGYRADNPAGEALDGGLPRYRRVQRSHRALPYQEVASAVETV